MYLKNELYELIRTDERIFDFIQESALDGLWYWDLENLENEWMNARFWTILGYNPDEMPHKSTAWQNIINQDDLKVANDNFIKHCENPNHPYDQVVRYTHKDGSTVWIRCRGLAIRDKGGKPIRMLGAHQDVSDLKNSVQELLKANEKVRESEEKYRAFYNNSPLSYQSLDENGCFIDINPMWSKTLGYERVEVIGKWYGDFLHPDYVEHFRKNFPAFKKRGYVSDVQFKLRRKDYTYIYVAFEGCVGYTPEGKFKQTYCVFKDITEQKALEYALIKAKESTEKSEEKLMSIFRVAPTGIGVIINRTFIEVNPKVFEMTGYRSEELVGQSSRILYPTQEEYEFVGQEKYKQIAKYGTGTVETRWQCKDGKIIDVLLSSTPLNSNDLSKGITFTALDISERIKAEQDIIAAKEKAEESDRLKSAFLANMSHEIRTPMNGILGFADLLKKPGLKGEKQQAFIKIIEKSGKRMLNIINDIVDISKIEAGLMELNVKESNINEQIEYIYTFFQPETEAKKIKFSFKSPLPATESIIKTDNEKVYAILANLIKNAIKYTEEGSIELGYKLKTDSKPGELEFYVKDTGIGIPKDRHEAIFDRFIQADITDKMAHQGAGLGLAITKAYVEMLGGRIWVESVEGKGSIFYFTLPYDTEPAAETMDREIDSSEKNDDIRKLKILIVEDDEVSEMLLDETVKMFGKEILKARTGVEAVEVCRDNPDIDLIMMDIRMPEMGGYEATRQIREFNQEVIIIAQTAHGLSGDREKSIESGCNDYIAKPINKDELLALINKNISFRDYKNKS